MVSDSQNKTSKPTIKILPDLENKTSSLALIEDIHDRSKNKNDAPSKTFPDLHAVWTLMGSLVAIIAVLAGMVMISLLIVNYILWKRYLT